MPRKPSQPSYRYHKARACAVVTIDGKNHYLGPWQPPESHEKYTALITEWRRNGGALPSPTADANNVRRHDGEVDGLAEPPGAEPSMPDAGWRP